jgi:hypothetical protein
MAKAKEYTVKKRNGAFWVITPSGKTIAVSHKTQAEARTVARVFNHTKRDESTVVTTEAKANKRKAWKYEQSEEEKGAAYLNIRGASCPYCGGITEGSGMDFNGGEIIQKIACSDCHATWLDIFSLSAIATRDGKTIASIAIPAEGRIQPILSGLDHGRTKKCKHGAKPFEHCSSCDVPAKKEESDATRFIGTIARMKTEDEFGEDVPPTEDWIATLNNLIAEARSIDTVESKPVIVEVNAGVVTNVWHAKEWHVIDWDSLLGDGADTKAAWEKLSAVVREEIEREYSEDFDKIQDQISLASSQPSKASRILTRRFFAQALPNGKQITIDVRTGNKVSDAQALTNAEEFAAKKLRSKSVRVTLIDLHSDVKPDFSIGPRS